ncbi:PLD nuclease N-terminal domain-containing protein [Agromyces sp. LHK192]|uniref:PLD nuclease N-terminal domain-containing protein n=1 Tax=Agromyces sp. LHK192 TaxID=2498704 RepID=UPI000FDA02F6|nr:PLD nuclease N-terminal domain-containing protein [Agromyces sp. LHK192]
MPVLTLLILAVLVIALVDIIRRDDWQVKHLPKIVWVLLVVFLPLIGSILWFTIGREYDAGGFAPRRRRPARPTTDAAPAPAEPRYPVDSRSTEEQIADLDREIEEWERRRALEAGAASDEPGAADPSR